MKKITLPQIRAKKGKEKITMITCYDASFARLVEKSGIDCVLVGDSLGMVIKGDTSTLGVENSEVEYHVKAVRKGAPGPFLIADMPFGSYQSSIETGMENAIKLIKAGAESVKVEGGSEVAPFIEKLVSFGVPVVGHVGLTPQYINKFGGYGKRGKTKKERDYILESAVCLEKAGADMIVLEGIPAELAAEITGAISIPTIGIGAGPDTDGQVLVIYDLLGINSEFNPGFLKKYLNLDDLATCALQNYASEVRSKKFPLKS